MVFYRLFCPHKLEGAVKFLAYSYIGHDLRQAPYRRWLPRHELRKISNFNRFPRHNFPKALSSAVAHNTAMCQKIEFQGVPILNTLKTDVCTQRDLDDSHVDLLVIGFKVAENLETTENSSPKIEIPSVYSKKIAAQMQAMLDRRKFDGKDTEYITSLLERKDGSMGELAALGLGLKSNIQYSIIDKFDAVAHSDAEASSVDVINASNAGKTLAQLIQTSRAEKVMLSFKVDDLGPDAFEALIESLLLNLTPDERFKSAKKFDSKKFELKSLSVHLVLADAAQADDAHISSVYAKAIEKSKVMAGAVQLAKEFCNTPANICTTEAMGAYAKQFCESQNMQCTVLGLKECSARGMGAYLGVHAGSKFAPQFIHFKYAGKTPKTKIALIGKGICMDTGGYNLKVGAGIETMKYDMSAAAALFGVAKFLAKTKPDNIEAHFIIPAAENMIDSNATRPGDILTASNGVTIEVGNTDAEGRLTLADALIYAEKEVEPDYIVDMATLTGACMVGLGCDIAAIYSTSTQLMHALLTSAKYSGTPIWPMPLYSPYRPYMDSKLADMNNLSSNRYGGSITAALFLKDFVKKTAWCHIDMAGPATYASSNLASGYGTKLLAALLMSMDKNEGKLP